MEEKKTIKVNDEIQNIRVLIESCDETNWDLAYIILLDRYHGEEDVASFKTQKLLFDYWSLMVGTTNDGTKEQWPGLTNDLGTSGMLDLTKKMYSYISESKDFKEKHFLGYITYNPFNNMYNGIQLDQGWYHTPQVNTLEHKVQYTGLNTSATPADHSILTFGTGGTQTNKKEV